MRLVVLISHSQFVPAAALVAIHTRVNDKIAYCARRQTQRQAADEHRCQYRLHDVPKRAEKPAWLGEHRNERAIRQRKVDVFTLLKAEKEPAEVVARDPDEREGQRIADESSQCRCQDVPPDDEGKQPCQEKMKTDKWRERCKRARGKPECDGVWRCRNPRNPMPGIQPATSQSTPRPQPALQSCAQCRLIFGCEQHWAID